MEFLPGEIQDAVTIAVAMAALASGIWQGIRIFASGFDIDTPKWLNILGPTVLSVVAASYAMTQKGYDAVTIAVAIVVALSMPKVIYTGADAIDRAQKELKKGNGTNG